MGAWTDNGRVRAQSERVEGRTKKDSTATEGSTMEKI